MRGIPKESELGYAKAQPLNEALKGRKEDTVVMVWPLVLGGLVANSGALAAFVRGANLIGLWCIKFDGVTACQIDGTGVHQI